MKIKHILFLIISIFLIISQAEAVSSNDFYLIDNINEGPHQWDVPVRLKGFYPSEKLPESFSITPGQTWGGWTVDSNKSRLTVYANRTNSSTPVTWVKNILLGFGVPWDRSYMITPYNKNINVPAPDNLNFAIVGTLMFTWDNEAAPYFCNNVIIAQQGNVGSSNRNIWWMFNNIGSSDSVILSCMNLNGKKVKVYVTPGNDVNEFTFQAMSWAN